MLQIVLKLTYDYSYNSTSKIKIRSHFDHYPMDSKIYDVMWLFDQYLGPNEIEQANGVTLDKDYKSFCPKLVFFLQIKFGIKSFVTCCKKCL